jgi:hypothetical protein
MKSGGNSARRHYITAVWEGSRSDIKLKLPQEYTRTLGVEFLLCFPCSSGLHRCIHFWYPVQSGLTDNHWHLMRWLGTVTRIATRYLDFPKKRPSRFRFSCSKLSTLRGTSSSFRKSARSGVDPPSLRFSISWFRSILGDSLNLLKIGLCYTRFPVHTFFSRLSIVSNLLSRLSTYLRMQLLPLKIKCRMQDFTLSRDPVPKFGPIKLPWNLV